MRMIAALAASLIAAGPALAQDFTPPVGGPFYNTGGNDAAFSFAAAGTAKREGDVAQMTRIVMFTRVREIEGVEVGRLDTMMEYQCEKAQMRPTIIAARGMDNALLKVIPRPDAEWQDITASNLAAAYELELACNGIVPAERSVFPDIDVRINRYRATGQ
ncbi:hypothetical protein P1X14_07365 [Sphingomonas sp. AOB5]|uniref:hypothetical protein n=1 Tax=Sphingomonas sp. AOB5 TaxID=3034017 RepID=UPI0023F640C1|nr:hypothetical protein [Sphingomonas sp. AOB5]MDF7775059.1 hypothetical protein [Sphingomonas sp. AOB5]